MAGDKFPEKTDNNRDTALRKSIERVVTHRKEKERERKEQQKKKEEKKKKQNLSPLQKRKLQELSSEKERRVDLSKDLRKAAHKRRKSTNSTFYDRVNNALNTTYNGAFIFINSVSRKVKKIIDELNHPAAKNKRNKEFLGDYLSTMREKEESKNSLKGKKESFEEKNSKDVDHSSDKEESNRDESTQDSKEQTSEESSDKKSKKEESPKLDLDDYLAKRNKSRNFYLKEKLMDREMKKRGF